MATATGVLVQLKKDVSATGGGSVNGTNAFQALLPGDITLAAKAAPSMAMSLQDGGDTAWSLLGAEADPIDQLAYPGVVPTSTPATAPLVTGVTATEVLPPDGSYIEVLHHGETPFSLMVPIGVSLGDLTREDIYQEVADALVAAGITATVDTTTFADTSVIKIAAAELFGDKQPYLAYWMAGATSYGYAVAGTDDAGDPVASDADDVYLGSTEPVDTLWIFPRSLGFINIP